MRVGRGLSGAIATHAALTTGIHGVGASTIADAGDITTHAAISATGSVKGHATAAQITKLNAIQAAAQADQTGVEIVALLEALSGVARLSHTKISDIGATDHQDAPTLIGTHATDVDAHHVPTGAMPCTVALGQALTITGDCANVTDLNNNSHDPGNEAYFDTVNKYAEFDYGIPVMLNQFRQYGYVTQNGNGTWTIKYWSLVTQAWIDWVTGVLTRDVSDFGAWDSSGGTIITNKLRIVCTLRDTVGGGRSYIDELEFQYA